MDGPLETIGNAKNIKEGFGMDVQDFDDTEEDDEDEFEDEDEEEEEEN